MGSHAPQHRSQSARHARSAPAIRALRPITALLLVAGMAALAPAQAGAGQLTGLLDKPLSNLLGALPGGTTRVIVRTDRGALATVVRLVTLLGGRVVAQHKLIDAL